MKPMDICPSIDITTEKLMLQKVHKNNVKVNPYKFRALHNIF